MLQVVVYKVTVRR